MNMIDCTEIGDESAKAMEEVLRRQPGIEDIRLGFGGTSITNDGVGKLLLAIAELRRVKQFSFQLKGCTSLTEERCLQLADVVACMPSLEFLSLGLDKCQLVGDRTLDRISKAIAGKSSLGMLHLLLTETQVTDEGFVELVKEIAELPLSALTLDVSRTAVSDVGTWRLCEALVDKPLSTFLLNLTSCRQVTDGTVASLIDLLRINKTITTTLFWLISTEVTPGEKKRIRSIQREREFKKFFVF
eukprot:TRINITY_DN9716_c0_g3_i2.p1 TRINITY_DN9716_c0_g3~~TRINITY_DN9716_c0_g3_i2.p1  ORF type:complete len:244 (+),score=27.56 TRINITY_DN9716_c0_g3_i2:85-816(+)